MVVSFYHDFLLDYNLIIKGSLLVFFSSLITAMAIIISHFLAQNQFILLLAPYTMGWKNFCKINVFWKVTTVGLILHFCKCFTCITKTLANLTTYSRKPGDYSGTIIFEIDIMKNSSPLNLKFTFFATVKTKITLHDIMILISKMMVPL